MTTSTLIRGGRAAGFEALRRISYDLPEGWRLSEMILELGRQRSEHFRLDDDNRWVYEQALRWAIADPAMRAIDPYTGQEVAGDLSKGLYLAGATGVGKTWLLELLSVFCSEYQLCYEMAGRGEHFTSKPLYWQSHHAAALTREYSRSGEVKSRSHRILCIQDLGTEHEQTLYMGNRCEVLRELIEERGDQDGLITHFSSNYPPTSDFVRQRYGDRAVRRLCAMTNYLPLYGKNRSL